MNCWNEPSQPTIAPNGCNEPPSRIDVTNHGVEPLSHAMSELRRDPVSGRWVVIAPERSRRPQDFTPQPVGAVGGDLCPFCEGQEAVAGREILAWRDPASAPDGPGWQVRVVANREPALRVESTLDEATDPLFQSLGGLGAHEVVIESPDHRASFATMTGEAVGRVLWAWRERLRDLRKDMRLKSFVVVKNVGAMAGALLDHAHSQLLALPLVPRHLGEELVGAVAYHAEHNRCVFCDLIAAEIRSARRLVCENDGAVVLAPFASRVPFETWVIPRAHHGAVRRLLRCDAGSRCRAASRRGAASPRGAGLAAVHPASAQRASGGGRCRVSLAPRAHSAADTGERPGVGWRLCEWRCTGRSRGGLETGVSVALARLASRT